MARQRPLTVLAVFAHPDDEALACGGTLARLAAGGARTAVLCASRGESGAPPASRGAAVGRRRAAEMHAAAEGLGVAVLVLLDFPDGSLRWAHVAELQAHIAAAIGWFEPDAVITFDEDGLYWHPDHIGLHERTTTALSSLGAAAPPLYCVSLPPGAMTEATTLAAARGWRRPAQGVWSLSSGAFGLHPADPTLSVRVDRWMPHKLAALAAHVSQTGAASPLALLSADEAARLLGVERLRRAAAPGCAAFEAALRDIT